jgi:hypothetical protein
MYAMPQTSDPMDNIAGEHAIDLSYVNIDSSAYIVITQEGVITAWAEDEPDVIVHGIITGVDYIISGIIFYADLIDFGISIYFIYDYDEGTVVFTYDELDAFLSVIKQMPE